MSVAPDEGRRFTSTTVFICGGLLIWAADFLLLYVVAALACAKGFAHVRVAGLPFVAFFGTLVTLGAMAGTALIVRVAVRRLRAAGDSDRALRFIYLLAGSLGRLALVAIFFNALPAWLLATDCGR